jgi:hypothetical protein
MINIVLSFFLFLIGATTNSNAGSICNDGTYSYSEGRGTCSHHGGVSTSGVYQNYSTENTNISFEKPQNYYGWTNEYNVSKGGLPFYSATYTSYANRGSVTFSYTCYAHANGPAGELLMFAISSFDVEDQADIVSAPAEHIRVFSNTNSGYKLISGDWMWRSEGGTLLIMKTNSFLDSLVQPLSKTDMLNIILSGNFIISVEGHKDVAITVPNLSSIYVNTIKKCMALSSN